MNYVYPAIFHPESDGGFLVTFPDVPGAITQGDDFLDAKASASDALGLALRGYLVHDKPLPIPSKRKASQVDVPVEMANALKIAVIEAFRASGMSKSEFARRLGKAENEARRILDPDHPTKLATLDAALKLFGKQVFVSIGDAA
ncbi:type II toxin-antitoxin system HicB family antitoxin [Kumtagia ephedrae]|uniref:HicB family protein n=1 Tax=Kumtagia ephedrae TaxID=2116701 RepID=A0A2P7SDM4_9HYPH|nr:type II toxin-antitoxin system HicB family antitoxin [Mesorhizobium ephedrae]PSJ60609.1 HicB family protein [Mesorhizobium ephedrae]